MGYSPKVVAIVDRPTSAQELACIRYKRGKGLCPTSNGSIVLGLRIDVVATADRTPDRWKVTGSVSLPRINLIGDGPPPPFVYSVPADLGPAQFGIQQDEFGSTGVFAYLAAGWDGKALKPYLIRRKSNQDDRHGSASFSEPALSRVGWFARRGRGATEYTLEIDRARLSVEGGVVVLYRESLLNGHIVPAPPVIPRLRDELTAWQPAVNALCDRLICLGCGATSHYRAF